MNKLIIGEFKKSFKFLIIINLISSILYFALCLNGIVRASHVETNNLDYIIPIFILVILFYNFKYLKSFDDYSSNLSMPITTKKLFNLKYIMSIIYLSIIFVVLFIISIPIFIYAENKSDIVLYSNQFNLLYYIFSLFIKYILSILIFNFFLYFFIKGKKLLDSTLYILLSIIVLSVSCVLFVIIMNIEIDSLLDIVCPINILDIWTTYTYFISNEMIYKAVTIIYLYIIIVFVIISVVTTILLALNEESLSIEHMHKHKTLIIHKFIILLLSLTCSILFSITYENYAGAISFCLIINVIFYLIYANLEMRFIPNKIEKVVYILLFLLSVTLPYYI